ncbi:MAG: zinc ribbon domain-containing protein [Actinomycetota bacterium]
MDRSTDVWGTAMAESSDTGTADEGAPMPRPLWTVVDGSVQLRGTRCLRCGTVAFPPQRYGCPSCGADGDALVESLIPAAGTLHTFTTVHLDPKHETPFQVGEVATSADPLVRGRLRIDRPRIGQELVARIRVDEAGETLEFVAAESGAAEDGADAPETAGAEEAVDG